MPGSVRACLVLGDPRLNRTQRFMHAARAEGLPIESMPYSQILGGGTDWPERLANRWVRLESPGRDVEVEQALLVRGAALEVEPACSRIPAAALGGWRRDPGLLFATRQWFFGWRNLLEEIARAGTPRNAAFLNSPDEIVAMFDKPACHGRLARAGVPVPAALPPPASFDDLMDRLRTAGWSRAYLKTSHGSGANGVVALAFAGTRIQAHTAIEVVAQGDVTRLYSTRRERVYRDAATVRRLVDALCRERVHVEAWVPKAGIAGRTADVRVVVIAGQASHLMGRLALGTITSVHLDGTMKATEDLLRRSMGEKTIALLRATAEKAAACFPASLSVGVDLAVTPAYRRAYVLEMNAFGDLLEDVSWNGADTYTWEVRAMLGRSRPLAQVSCTGW